MTETQQLLELALKIARQAGDLLVDRPASWDLTVKSTAIDMETATLFTVGFANKIPRGALLLVSDNPMVPEGVKTSKSDESVTVNYVALQLSIGIQALNELRDSGDSVKHMRFE